MLGILGVLLLAAADPVEGAPVASQPAVMERPAIAGRRIIKHFDFNEQPLGNYTSLPMFWRRHGAPGFPMFLEGRFDREEGRASAPAFRLDLDGGSVGYHYEGRDIAVRTSSDYLVVAWIRTEGLETARAYVTACFLDRKGIRIEGTERRSTVVGGSGKTDWTPVTIALPGSIANSRYIGVSLWLTQSYVWDESTRPPRHVEREDVKGTAWFDDITAYRLPRVTLRTASAGNVFTGHETVELRSEVSDPDGLGLSGRLVIRDADGQVIDDRPAPIGTGESGGMQKSTYRLPPGLYEAELLVTSGETVLVRRHLRFVRLEAPIRVPQSSGGRFGLILENTSGAALAGQSELLRTLGFQHVKIPVWCAQRAGMGDPQATPSGREPSGAVLDRYLQAIIDAGAEPVGVLVNDQRALANDPGRKVRSLADIMSEDPRTWKPLIAGLWSRYAGLIHVWQIGADGDASIGLDPRLPSLVSTLRREMGPLVGRAVLAAVGDTYHAPDAGLGADFESILIPGQTSPDVLPGQVGPVAGPQRERAWLTVEPLADAGYPRIARLSDFARRLVEAAFQNTRAVFVAAPWEVEADLLGCDIRAREDLIVLRTVADLLGGTTPVSRMNLDGQAHCLVFDRNGMAVVFAWDAYAPPEGRAYLLPLGDSASQVDLWDRRTALEEVGSHRRVRIGPVPTFLIDTPTWLTEFRRQVRVDPCVFEASFDSHQQSVCFRNTFHQPISGMLHVEGPPDWDIRPNRMSFVLQPGEEFRQAISLRFPLNAESGLTPLAAEFSLDADRRYDFIVPAWFELGLRDVDVDTYVYRTGSRVIVRQTMSNRTDAAVSFEGYVIAPERPRITRTFVNAQPRQTMIKDFILDDATDLAGQRIRIGLKEIQGSRVWNRIVTVP